MYEYYNKPELICERANAMKCDDIKDKIRWLCDLCFRNEKNTSDDDLTTPLE